MTSSNSISMFLSCEHGGNRIPPEYQYLFKDHSDLLETHRGWDIGALTIAQSLQTRMQLELDFCDVSRLLIDTNRYINGRGPFSEISEQLSSTEKQRVIDRYYQPHWDSVITRCRKLTSGKNQRALHLSVHSMTDNLNGQVRSMQLALLFDPQRNFETNFVGFWQRALQQTFPDYEIALNEPYRGDDEGMTTYLRTQFPDTAYAGIELEMNQGLLQKMDEQEKERLSDGLAQTLQTAVLKTTQWLESGPG